MKNKQQQQQQQQSEHIYHITEYDNSNSNSNGSTNVITLNPIFLAKPTERERNIWWCINCEAVYHISQPNCIYCNATP